MIIPRKVPITLKRLRQIENQRIGNKYKNWKDAVLARDGHKCQWPNCNRSENLEVHHIRKYNTAVHLRHAVFNGITLCDMHHKFIFNRETMYEVFFFKIVAAITKKYEEEKKNKQTPKKEDSKDADNSGHEGTGTPKV